MSRPQRTRPASSSPLGRPTLTPSVEPLTVGTPPAPAANSQTPAVTDSKTHRETDSQTPAVRQSGSHRPPSRGADVPRWQTFVRKEARLRGDQADELARLRRRLAQSRNRREETITDNTLIRVAVDLLLAQADHLHGDTEDELRDSVTHRLPNSGSL